MLNYLPRSSWGARPPKSAVQRWAPGNPKGVVVHWVGGKGSLAGADPFSTVRSIQAHQMSGDYIDIAYNLLVDRSGRIIEGRGVDYRGAANGPSTNATHLSVCVLDNVDDQPTIEAKLAVFRVWQHVGGDLLAHREVNTTTCPGEAWAAWVRGVRESRSPGEAPRTPQEPVQPLPGGGSAGKSLADAVRRVRDTIHRGPVLRRGSRGQPVADWQLALIVGATRDVKVDGDFGPRTEAATRDFQRFFGLVVDGVVGPRTREAMAFTLKVKIR